MKKTPYTEVKYPRVQVSNARHKALFMQARKEGITMDQLAERQLKAAKKAGL